MLLFVVARQRACGNLRHRIVPALARARARSSAIVAAASVPTLLFILSLFGRIAVRARKDGGRTVNKLELVLNYVTVQCTVRSVVALVAVWTGGRQQTHRNREFRLTANHSWWTFHNDCRFFWLLLPKIPSLDIMQNIMEYKSKYLMSTHAVSLQILFQYDRGLDYQAG